MQPRLEAQFSVYSCLFKKSVFYAKSRVCVTFVRLSSAIFFFTSKGKSPESFLEALF